MNSGELRETTTQTSEIAPEWITTDQACAFARIGKTCLYYHLDISGGEIQTACIRKRNRIRGRRLVSIDSLRAFINSQVEGGANDE